MQLEVICKWEIFNEERSSFQIRADLDSPETGIASVTLNKGWKNEKTRQKEVNMNINDFTHF